MIVAARDLGGRETREVGVVNFEGVGLAIPIEMNLASFVKTL